MQRSGKCRTDLQAGAAYSAGLFWSLPLFLYPSLFADVKCWFNGLVRPKPQTGIDADR